MAGELVRVVARVGLAAQIALAELVPGEIGWNIDDKVFRVGDDTTDAPRIATSKSTGFIEYLAGLKVRFGTIEMHDDHTVDGVDISKLNEAAGILVRGLDPNTFFQRTLEHDQYLQIENPDGAGGNPKIGISPALIELLQSIGSGVNFTYGEEPPATAVPGTIFFSTNDEVLYLRVTDSTNPERGWWMDFSSVGSEHRNGGVSYFSGPFPPPTSAPGDLWYDTEDDRMYVRHADENGFHWRDTRF